MLEMIPSENHTSPAVREALASVLTDKYTEGFPGNRYYSGVEYYDQLESLVQERAKKLFNVEHANVQPYSGSPANHAVYFATCKPGDKIMGMSLPHGGHLTHGAKVSFSGRYYNSVFYTVDEKKHLINYSEIERLAKKEKPKLIWCGTSAYPRKINWQKIAKIGHQNGAYVVADIAHIAGLVIGGSHPDPAPYVDIITTTSHKTMRGPRGGIIMVTKRGAKNDPELAKKIDKAVFPGLQGGPHQNQIAALGVALKEASTKSFRKYIEQIVKNSDVLARELKGHGFNLITGGTDNHLVLIDLTKNNIKGKQAQDLLEKAGIAVNKNTVPYDKRPANDPSGIRLGTPAITTRGIKEKQMRQIAEWINAVLSGSSKPETIKKEVESLCKNFPLP